MIRRAAGNSLAAALALGLAAASCQGAAARSRGPLPVGAPEVTITMSEYRFEPDRVIPAGRVVFRIHNAGHLDHLLTLVPLPEDMPPIDQQLHSTTRRSLDFFAGIYPRVPGGSGTFAVDLVAGRRYALLCFVADADGVNHALKGMTYEFRPGTPGTPGTTPHQAASAEGTGGPGG